MSLFAHSKLPSARSTRPLRMVIVHDSLGDKFKDFMAKVAFENWAPRSSRAWRLRQYPSEASRQQQDEDDEKFVTSLEERMRRLSEDASSVSQRAADPVASFTDTEDDDISSALASRVDSLRRSGSVDEDFGTSTAELTTEDLNAPLTAVELIQLVEAKYGKKYDLTIARRTFAGKDFVSLNIMWVHVGQRSFPMSFEQFVDKMDGICIYLNAWNKQEQVRTFMKQKPKSTLGLPPRPIVGVAVPLQLDLDQAVIKEWLGDRLG